MIERKFKKSRMELENMKALEDTLLDKFYKTKTNLNKSMTKMNSMKQSMIRC